MIMKSNKKLNIIYMTLDDFDNIDNYYGINTDLLREFRNQGHNIYVISPTERKKGLKTRIIYDKGVVILKPKIGNIQKTNIFEKGISTITISNILIKNIKRKFNNIVFDLVLYCTPPITFLSVVKFIKNRDNATTYLLLKDIFPQNAVDFGLLKKTGIKGIIYNYFRNKEKQLYEISDYIGCMSKANVDYIYMNNKNISLQKIEICPNSIDIIDKTLDIKVINNIKIKNKIPLDKKIFIYGGNLGRVQGINFLIECLAKCSNFDDVFFLIVGDGTEYHVLDEYINSSKQKNVKLIKFMPREEYDKLVAISDIGLIFLDYKNTIPNFPSRMLGYMQNKKPILAVTDISTDIGKIIIEGNFGWWCESNNSNNFVLLIKNILNSDIKQKGLNAYNYLIKNYSVKKSYSIIMKHMQCQN